MIVSWPPMRIAAHRLQHVELLGRRLVGVDLVAGEEQQVRSLRRVGEHAADEVVDRAGRRRGPVSVLPRHEPWMIRRSAMSLGTVAKLGSQPSW